MIQAARTSGKTSPRQVLASELVRIRGGFQKDSPAAPRTTVRVPDVRAPGALFWAYLLAAVVRPTVRGARRTIFGTERPPFARFEDAVDWLMQEAARGDSGPEIHYWDKDGRGQILLAGTTKLLNLATATAVIEERTRNVWGEEVSLIHLLTGAIPVGPDKPRLDVRTPQRDVAQHGIDWLALEITLYPWHFPMPGEVVRRLATASPIASRMTGHDAMLLDLVVTVGLPPQKRGRGKRVGRAAYWKRLADEWKRRYGKPPTTNALRMMWERAEQRHANVIAALRKAGIPVQKEASA